MTRVCCPALVLMMITVLVTAMPPRHVNPEEIELRGPDPQALTSTYTLLAELLSAESYKNVSQLVNLLLNISASPDLAYVLRRFHEGLLVTNELFNISRSYLEQAKRLVLAGRIEDSMLMLSEVIRVLAKVNLTRADLELAAREVQHSLGAQPAPLLKAISELLIRHMDEAASLSALMHRRDTELVIEVEPRSAWVGSTALIIGRLTSLGEPLLGKKVTITVGGSIVGSVLTDEGGFFMYRLKLPYIYRRSLTVGALYVPEADDAKVYKPSSNSTEILLLYETPRLSVLVNPPEVLPGDRLEIEVRADRPGLRIRVRALRLVHQLVLFDSVAMLYLEVPANIPEGVYRVVASSEPNGTLGPASAEATVVVRKLDLKLSVLTPPLLVALFPARFYICVEGWNGTPPAYSVKLSLAGALVEAESKEACTTLETTIPPLTPTGSMRAEVAVIPVNPRFRPTRVEVQTFVINPLLLAPTVGLIIPIILLAKPRLRDRRSEAESFRASELLKEGKEPYSFKLKSTDPVVSEYLASVRAVERATNVLLEPDHTISEYLELVEPKLGEAAKPFAALSLLMEAKLYGGLTIPLEVARTLRDQLEKLLGGAP